MGSFFTRIWDLSLEKDEEEEAEFKAKTREEVRAPADLPPQLLFVHQVNRYAELSINHNRIELGRIVKQFWLFLTDIFDYFPTGAERFERAPLAYPDSRHACIYCSRWF